jgi:acetyl-CoA synthetase
MLPRANSYQALINQFEWQVPQRYNIAWDICDKWIEEDGRTALVYETTDGIQKRYTFKDIHLLSNQLANSR